MPVPEPELELGASSEPDPETEHQPEPVLGEPEPEPVLGEPEPELEPVPDLEPEPEPVPALDPPEPVEPPEPLVPVSELDLEPTPLDPPLVPLADLLPDPEPPPPEAAPAPPRPAPEVDAGFENGFRSWNMNGVGDVAPTLVDDVVREGSSSARVALTDSQSRSELTLGGSATDGTVQFYEGDERFYGFSFNVREMTYGRPGAHNLVMQLKSDGEGSPTFGLQLWDHDGRRGIWSHGGAMGGDRFLHAIDHEAWYDVVVHFKASSTGAGFYDLYLNGELIDSRDQVSTILPGHRFAYIKNGIYRNGGAVPGTSEIRLDAARLARSWAAASIR